VMSRNTVMPARSSATLCSAAATKERQESPCSCHQPNADFTFGSLKTTRTRCQMCAFRSWLYDPAVIGGRARRQSRQP
jgi:hypothetical protein